jgi:translation initiation factor IF-2
VQLPARKGDVAVRIYALAKDLDIDSKDLVEVCRKAGISGKGSALASLTDDEVTKVKAFLRGGDKKSEAGQAPAGTAARRGAPEVYRREDYIAPVTPGKVKVLDVTARRPASKGEVGKPVEEVPPQEVEPPQETVPAPVVEPVAEPGVERVAEPGVERVAEPAVVPATEPGVAVSAEPAVVSFTEPVLTPAGGTAAPGVAGSCHRGAGPRRRTGRDRGGEPSRAVPGGTLGGEKRSQDYPPPRRRQKRTGRSQVAPQEPATDHQVGRHAGCQEAAGGAESP